MRLLFAIVVFVALFSIRRTFAHIAHVGEGQSIQVAVDSLNPGDTIIVSPGNYFETVVLFGKDLTIAGEWLLTGDTTLISQTVIHASNSREDTTSCLVYAYGESANSRLAGLTLSTGGGTLWTAENAMAGGALYIWNSSLIVRRCIISSCEADWGGGIFAGSDSQHTPVTVALDSCTITACSSGTFGGGMYVTRAELSVSSCRFDRNVSESYGAGLFVDFSSFVVHRSSFEQNRGANGGAFISNCDGIVSESRFADNFSTSASASALTIGHCCVDVTGNLFTSDTAVGLVVSMCCSNEDTINFTGNTVQGMQGDSRPVITLGGISGDISYNLFQRNHDFRSGTLYGFQNTRTRIHHNVFAENSIEAGNVLVTGPDYRGQFYDNFIERNIGPCIRDAVAPQDSIDVRNNWWGHESGPYHVSRNPGGLGDTIGYDMAIFEPWLNIPPDTSSSNNSGGRNGVLSTWHLFALYPNPFNNEFRIDIAGFARDNFAVKLYDLLGREVAMLHSGNVTGGTIHFTAPPTLSSGIYFVKASDRIQTETKKVVLLK